MLSLADFGAVADGVTNCDAAFASFVDEVIGQQRLGIIPSGAYRVSQGILRNVAAERFAIRGESRATTRILCDNAPNGLVFKSTARAGACELSDMTVIARGECGTGIGYTAPEGGAQHHTSLFCRNVLAEGENDTTDDFTTFFDFGGTWHAKISNCQASGPWVGVDNSDASQRFDGKVGFNLNGAYSPWLDHIYAWGQERAIISRSWESAISSVEPCAIGSRIVCAAPHPLSNGFKARLVGAGAYTGTHTVTVSGATTFDIAVPFTVTSGGTVMPDVGPEAFWISNFVINGCKKGIDFRRPQGREPLFKARSGHINFRDEGISLDGSKLALIDAIEFYNEDADNFGPGNARDIVLKNAADYKILDNHFWFNGAPDRINIFVESDDNGKGHNGTIAGNTFAANGHTGVWLSSKCRNVRVTGNDFRGVYTGSAVNDVSGLNHVEV